MTRNRETSISILYLGPDYGTSRHRALALRRLGHEVSIVDPRKLLPRSGVLDYWIYHSGCRFLEAAVGRRLLAKLPPSKYDLVWIDGGHLIGPVLVSELKRRYGTVVNYNVDDPYGYRNQSRWRLYLSAVPYYDLITVVQERSVTAALATGAQRVLHISRSADEVAHSPRHVSEEDHKRWACEVAFIGTWMPERGPF